MADHYQTLGVAADAGYPEIKKAYRRLALQLHPDRNPGDKEAEKRFKKVVAAYAVLSDPKKRHDYELWGDEPRGTRRSPQKRTADGQAFHTDDLVNSYIVWLHTRLGIKVPRDIARALAEDRQQQADAIIANGVRAARAILDDAQRTLDKSLDEAEREYDRDFTKIERLEESGQVDFVTAKKAYDDIRRCYREAQEAAWRVHHQAFEQAADRQQAAAKQAFEETHANLTNREKAELERRIAETIARNEALKAKLSPKIDRLSDWKSKGWNGWKLVLAHTSLSAIAFAFPPSVPVVGGLLVAMWTILVPLMWFPHLALLLLRLLLATLHGLKWRRPFHDAANTQAD